MSAQIPPVPDNPVVGFVDWQDVVHNVRALDLEWLQNRTVVRFDNVSAANSYAGDPSKVPGSLEEGQVVYFVGPKQLAVKTGASTYQYALLSGLLAVADAGSIASISNAGTGGITLPADGSVGVPLLKVAVDRVVADSAGLHLKTGTAVANITTSATDLVSDIPIQAPTLKAAGAVQAASAAFTGAVSAASLSASTVAVSGAASVGSLAAASAVTAASASFGAGATTISNSGIATNTLSASGAITATGNVASSADLVSGIGRGVYTDNLYLNAMQFQWEASTNGIIRNTGSAWERQSKDRLVMYGDYGNGDGLSPNPAEQQRHQMMVQAATSVTTLSGAGSGLPGATGGDAVITLPTGFPRGMTTVLVFNGNTDQFANAVLSAKPVNKGQFMLHAANGANGLPLGGTTLQVNYVAFGW